MVLQKWLGYGYSDCEQTYKECFYAYSLLSLKDGQQINIDQFNDLVMAVYHDISLHHPSQYNPLDWLVRGHYDTPFWNGTYQSKDPNDPDKLETKAGKDTIVCFATICDKRSDINYFAQGMWDAAMGRTLDDALSTSEIYKHYSHGETLSDRTEYWIRFGYEIYQSLNSLGVP